MTEKRSEKKIEERELYDVWEESWSDGDGSGEVIIAKNKNGDYIGDVAMAEKLAEANISAELISEDYGVCSIGWSERAGRYYGWSHRACVGFAIGDMLFEERFVKQYKPFTKCGMHRIETKQQARKAAVNFAEYIG